MIPVAAFECENMTWQKILLLKANSFSLIFGVFLCFLLDLFYFVAFSVLFFDGGIVVPFPCFAIFLGIAGPTRPDRSS